METQVEMIRTLFGSKIRQQSKTEFFSATDLIKAGNKWRASRELPLKNLSQMLKTESSVAFIKELHTKYNIVLSVGRGRNAQTWVHPLLFIDIALEISPQLKIEVYEWLFDNLIKFRNDSGNSYKEMSAAIWQRFPNKRVFPKYIKQVANYIKESCMVYDWEAATEAQLALRDKMHNSIRTLTNVLTSTDEAVRIGVNEHVKKVITSK
jgi:hypothetical protein